MSTKLSSFLAPGSVLGGVTQRICEFLSVQDLLHYVASVATPASSGTPEHTPDYTEASYSPAEKGYGRAGAGSSGRVEQNSGYAEAFTSAGVARKAQQHQPRSDLTGYSCQGGRAVSPEEEVPHGPGGGDEAGGGTRSTPARRSSAPYGNETQPGEGAGGWGACDGGGNKNSCRGVAIDKGMAVQHQQDHPGVSNAKTRETLVGSADGQIKHQQHQQQGGGFNLFGALIGFGLQVPSAAVGIVQGGVTHLLHGVPLLALLRWAVGGAEIVLGVTFKVALLPYDVTKGVVSYVVGALEAMLNVATEIWCELRHLSLSELACVVSCVVSGNSIPECLLPPLDGNGELYSGSGYSSAAGGILSRRSGGRFHGPRSSPSVSEGSLDSAGIQGLMSEFSRGRARSGASSMHSDDSRSGMSGSRGAWRQAHAMRRRLDRVNRTASLVSYEERAESAVPRAKAQRVRRRMHYAMSLQCFQATVTMDGRSSPNGSDGLGDGDSNGESRGGAGVSPAGPFMCTPQSFPPTPVSRAHVMQRTSQFADDILFLARDQLRLGENLKPGVDETTRATADFLRQQQRLAVLDGHNACEGIRLTCGHHCATKVGPSLYSSVRAMVPVLRNRHVYFQVSCKRDGPLAPCIGVGLSTPEMPLSTLIGAFSNSVGLCSTGQILMSSRWYGAPGEYAVHKHGMSTVGVLVYLDGSRSFRSWDGDMVRALVCFSVDGRLVRITNTGSTQPSQQYQKQQQPVTVHGTAAVDLSLVASQQQQDTLAARSALVSYGSADLGPLVEEVAPWEPAATAAVVPPASNVGGVGIGGLGAAVNPGSVVSGGEAAAAAGASANAAGASAALGLALPKDRDLFPTVTIHSPNTETLCRFCAEDLLPVTRDAVGAPPGVPVHALDGTLINLL